MKLASHFEDNDLALYLTPTDLARTLQVGSKQNWAEFLSLDPVRAYIRAQMAASAQIQQRAAQATLAQAAKSGDVQAAKLITEISGVLNSGDKSKTVVLHRVNRPQTNRTLEKEQPTSEPTNPSGN